MKRLRLLFVMVVLMAVVIGVVEPRAVEALPAAAPSCNDLYFESCTTIGTIVNCNWSTGETGACRCSWFVQEPYGFWHKIWDCYLTQNPN